MCRTVTAGILVFIAAAIAGPAPAAVAGADGARFAAALLAGHARAPALHGTGVLTQAASAGCSTHLAAGREDWTIDWKAASISPASTASTLKILLDRNNPDQEFWLRIGTPAEGKIALSAAMHLIQACAG
jgi:hypothetical protein